MKMVSILTVVSTLLAAVIGASAAQAEVRSLTVADPADALPTVSGKPNNPDLSQVSVSYDNSAGTISIVQNYYNAFPNLDTSQNYAFFTTVSLSGPSPTFKTNGAVEEEQCGFEGFSGSITDYSYNGSKYSNSFVVSGFSGSGNFTTTAEGGGGQVTATASSPVLVGHDWRCARVTLKANTRSTASNPKSNYDGGCECWAVNTDLDSVGTPPSEGLAGVAWFPGFPTSRESEEARKAREAKEAETKKKEAEAAKFKKGEEKQQAEERRRETVLDAAKAEADLKRELRRHFHDTFVRASAVDVSCDTKLTPSRRRCSIGFEGGSGFHAGHPVDFFQHRYDFRGFGQVWNRRVGSHVDWYYSWTLRRTDERCAMTRSATACAKVFVVK